MASGCPGKSRWPELVGARGKEAQGVVERQNSKVRAIVLREGTPVTLDFRCDRVWIWVDPNGRVTRAPTVG